ncbi:hypothetical protein J7M00_03645 [bacterium]|nr:hypothetical protein [bacterium]RKZ25044.1 MAG: hypothetical protein DRQ26_06570 [bacterium]
MANRFDERGFLVIPDPRELRRERREKKEAENKVIVVKSAYCPNGHDLMWDYASFCGYAGIRIGAEKPNGEKGEIVLSPIFGDHSRISLGIKLIDGEKLKLFCPECGAEIPVLTKCENCEQGEIRVLSLARNFDIANGIAFCDVVGCPSSYIVDSGELIEQAYLEG